MNNSQQSPRLSSVKRQLLSTSSQTRQLIILLPALAPLPDIAKLTLHFLHLPIDMRTPELRHVTIVERDDVNAVAAEYITSDIYTDGYKAGTDGRLGEKIKALEYTRIDVAVSSAL